MASGQRNVEVTAVENAVQEEGSSRCDAHVCGGEEDCDPLVVVDSGVNSEVGSGSTVDLEEILQQLGLEHAHTRRLRLNCATCVEQAAGPRLLECSQLSCLSWLMRAHARMLARWHSAGVGAYQWLVMLTCGEGLLVSHALASAAW